MRRGACLLALLGLTVQNAAAADQPGVGTARLNSASAAPAADATKAAPQKFTRSPANSGSGELANYYKELFGEAAPTSLPQSGLPSNTTLQPTSAVSLGNVNPTDGAQRPGSSSLALPKPAAEAAVEKEIIHAEYRGTQKAAGAIEQVGGDRFSARPFPGLSGGAPQTAAVPSTAPSAATSAPVAATPSPTATPSAASLRMPAATQTLTETKSALIESTREPAPGHPFGATAMSPPTAVPSSTKGTVTFSRGRPADSTARPTSGSMSKISTPTTVLSDSGVGASMAAAAPSVKLEWKKQSDINVGQECTCELVVSNVSQTTARDVEVRATFPTSIRLVKAEPAPAESQKFLGWTFDELKPGETRTLVISLIPQERGAINTRAEVRFSGSADGVFAVAEPLLDIQVEGPKQVLVGEPAAHVVTISNPGTGIADRVQIEAVLPEGLEHARGRRLLMELGSLNPGETRTVRLALAATRGGQHQLSVQAKSDGGLTCVADAMVNVIAPQIVAGVQGPSLRYVGRQGVYTVAVKNEGAAATDNVQVRYKIPEGFEFVSADRGAQFDAATGLLTCFVGRLEQNQISEIRVTLMARKLGECRHIVRATSEQGTVSDAECVTSIEGTSSLSIAVRDLEDPVEVGGKMTYEIRVRNEGSAAAKGVGLSCELPAGMTFQSAEGPAKFMQEGSMILFRSLPEVAAGETVTFKVSVSASVPGSMRFKAHLSSESIAEPLTAEELTKFYGER